MNNDALTLIPARVRQAIYVGLTLVSLLLTAAGAVFAAGPYPAPWWIAGALSAMGIVAAPFGVLAAANVQSDDRATVAEILDEQPDPTIGVVERSRVMRSVTCSCESCADRQPAR